MAFARSASASRTAPHVLRGPQLRARPLRRAPAAETPFARIRRALWFSRK